MAYFDYAASTPLDPDVVVAMQDAMNAVGNPSSVHAMGRAARMRIDESRKTVARLLQCEPSEIVFTSGATESNALAIRGACSAIWRTVKDRSRVLRIAISAIEHSSVRAAAEQTAAEYGMAVDVISVDGDGCVRMDSLREAVKDDTVFVCVMWANNVIGAIQPVADVARTINEVREKRGRSGLPLLFACDAVQAIATQDVWPGSSGIDLASFSGHKMYGPKGVGFLYIKKGIKVDPLIAGGGQEFELRSGTENTVGIAGIGAAAETLLRRRKIDAEYSGVMRQGVVDALRGRGFQIIGSERNVLPSIVYAVHPRIDGETLAMQMDVAGICVSTGSACDSGKRTASPVLRAVCDERTARRGGIRVSFGRFTSVADMTRVSDALLRLDGRR